MSPTTGAIERRSALRDAASLDDQSLADAIIADARTRADAGERVTLDRYLIELPGLAARTVPLDAAIEAAIEDATRTELSLARAVESLIAEHPELAPQIRDCAVLTSALCATHEIDHLFSETRSLPCEFGPVLESGAPRYVLLRTLGVGSSGTVYEAEDRVLSDGPARALVALKVLSRAAGRFAEIHWQEAAKANRVKHPNVVRALDRGTAPSGEQYAVFELVDGGDLESLANREGPLHPLDAAAIVAMTARGVHASHQAGLIHADLKPQNVLLTRDNTPKVSDFGVARRHDDSRGVTGPTGRVGGLAFMAPEQFRDPWDGATIAADVYALGGLLFWLLTGALPNGDSREDIEAALSAESAPRWREQSLKDRRVPATLRAVVLRAIAFDPGARHASAAELADELERFLHRLPVPSAKPTLLTRAGLWSRRHPTATVGIACLAIALTGSVPLGLNAWRLAAERAEQVKSLEAAQSLVTYLNTLDRPRFETEALMFLWALESLGGSGIIPDLEHWSTTATTERMRIIRGYIEDAIAREQGDSIETQLWRMTLANLMLNSPEPQPDALPLLERTIEVFELSLDPRDELLLQARAMHRVAQVKSVYHHTKDGGARTPALMKRLRGLGDELKADLDRLREDRPGSPVYFLVLRALDNLYKSNLLADPAAREPFRAERAALNQR